MDIFKREKVNTFSLFLVCLECFLSRWIERNPDTASAGSQLEVKGVAGNGRV